jgi:hypothetical protein
VSSPSSPVLACDKDEETPCNEAHFEASRACGDGVAFCGTDPDSEAYSWGICVEAPECMPEDNSAGTCEQCQLDDEGVPYIDYSACGGDTPLVLSFDGAAVEYGSGGRPFALGRCAATDWPTAVTPWLALDRDHSGQIDGGHELFGSATRLRGGQLADQGFAALAELDANGDGTISSDDPGFAELVLWADHDGDRRSTGLELQPLAAMGPRRHRARLHPRPPLRRARQLRGRTRRLHLARRPRPRPHRRSGRRAPRLPVRRPGRAVRGARTARQSRLQSQSRGGSMR